MCACVKFGVWAYTHTYIHIHVHQSGTYTHSPPHVPIHGPVPELPQVPPVDARDRRHAQQHVHQPRPHEQRPPAAGDGRGGEPCDPVGVPFPVPDLGGALAGAAPEGRGGGGPGPLVRLVLGEEEGLALAVCCGGRRHGGLGEGWREGGPLLPTVVCWVECVCGWSRSIVGACTYFCLARHRTARAHLLLLLCGPHVMHDDWQTPSINQTNPIDRRTSINQTIPWQAGRLLCPCDLVRACMRRSSQRVASFISFDKYGQAPCCCV